MLVLLEYYFQHTLPHKEGSSSHPCMNCLMTSRLHASKANRRQALCMQDSLTLKQLETGDVSLPFVLGTCVHSLFHPSTPSSNKVHFLAFDFSSTLLCFFSSISFFSSSLSSSHFCLFFFITPTPPGKHLASQTIMPSLTPTPLSATIAKALDTRISDHGRRVWSIQMDDETTRRVEERQVWNMPGVS